MINKIIYSLLLVLLVNFNNQILFGQDTKTNSETETVYFQGSVLFKYNIKLPKNYDPIKKQILVVGLHGFGGNSETFINLWDNLDDINFIYACPQAPYTMKMGENIGYDWSMWMSKDIEQINLASELTIQYISELVISLIKQYNIDTVYLMGFSQGAIFTYKTGIENYHLFDGIICMSGPGIFEPLMLPFVGKSTPDWLEEKYIKPAKSLRIFIAHGLGDKAVKYDLAITSKVILVDNGYNVTFETFEGGHTIDSNTLKRVFEWINNN